MNFAPTLLDCIRDGELGPHAESIGRVCDAEGVDSSSFLRLVAEGRIVVPRNANRELARPCAVGEGLRTKVNANIGTSQDYPSIGEELLKLRAALEAGADAMMDLSTGGDIPAIRARMLAECPVPLGSVPIYEAAARARDERGSISAMTAEDIFDAIESHARDGVDFLTVHTGICRRSVDALRATPRVMDVVSRGGALLIGWMVTNDRENPLYEDYDRLVDIARRYDVTLSLGDGMRPGCLADAGDPAQIEELRILGELRLRAMEAGVQVMIEGPGHVPLDKVVEQMRMEKELCGGAPFYVLGPLVTDIGVGRDHITAAIGGALAAMSGADFLCYVTPREHLGLPTVDDVREGVQALRLAAHAGDIAKKVPGAWERDLAMSRARKALDWETQMSMALDPATATRMHMERSGDRDDVCSMCGELCAMKVATDAAGAKGAPEAAEVSGATGDTVATSATGPAGAVGAVDGRRGIRC